MKTGKAIELLRRNKNIKQKDLAKACGISVTALCNFEKERYNPSQEVLKRICDALGVSLPCFLLYTIEDSDIPEEKRVAFNMFMSPLKQLLTQ